ncbi:MAG: FAD:protein FMN transferase [Lachnoclostridium sp.]|nr:FAD:protein FMN transferase [Lachnoclostridium sp.]
MNKHALHWIRLSACAFIGSAVLSLSGCGNSFLSPKSQTPIQRTDFLLNTFVDIKIYDTTDTTILDDVMALCKDLEAQFSRTIEGSEIYRLNHRRKDEQVFELSERAAELLSLSFEYCELSGGAFDITIEPVSSLWDFTSGEAVLPEADLIKEAVSKVGFENLLLENQTLTIQSPNTTIDLGAIAKGYIADEMKEYLIEQGVKSAVINLGGNVLCIGSKPDGEPFKIGLKKPFAQESETFAIADITDMSVVTSGVYERYFELDGKHYHHILNPQTGYPYENDLLSVTILSDSSADGDGLSTTCFSLGLEKGMELVNSLDGVYGCFIDEDYNIYYSEGMEAFLNET